MPPIVSSIVEVCVFRFRTDHPEYLLLQRAPDEELYPGLWQMVTGSIDGSESALAAALRELREETSLRPARLWVVPWVNTFYDRKHDAVQITPVVVAQVETRPEPVLSREHTAFEWLRVQEAGRRLVWPGQRRALEIIHEYIAGALPAAGFGEIPREDWP